MNTKIIKTAIFIDGITLYHGLNGNLINFNEFKNWLNENNDNKIASYFSCVDKSNTKHKFFMHVHKSGFQMFIRKPKYDFVKRILDTIDMNIELTTEAMMHINDYDKFILVSGKHDFLPLCEKLADNNIEVEIVGFKNNINKIFNKYKLRYVEDFIAQVNDNKK